MIQYLERKPWTTSLVALVVAKSSRDKSRVAQLHPRPWRRHRRALLFLQWGGALLCYPALAEGEDDEEDEDDDQGRDDAHLPPRAHFLQDLLDLLLGRYQLVLGRVHVLVQLLEQLALLRTHASGGRGGFNGQTWLNGCDGGKEPERDLGRPSS